MRQGGDHSRANAKRTAGQFQSLEDFAYQDHGKEDATTIRGRRDHFKTGQILSIIGTEMGVTRSSDRVLVVYKKGHKESMTCYGFCKHTGVECDEKIFQDTHMQVYDIKQQQMPFSKSKPGHSWNPLAIELSEGLRLQRDIWINVEEPWNIEYEVEYAPIGVVKDIAALKKAINYNEDLHDSD